MKKFLVATILLGSSLTYAFVERSQTSAPPPDTLTTAIDSSSVATPPADPSSSVAPATATPGGRPPIARPVTKPKTLGTFTDGAYVGSAADAYYGTVQVEAIISGGRLANVKVLQYPNDRGTSVEINRQALPMLISEAIAAQSAQVDAISGASDTSPAFVESLGAALAKAKA